MRNFGLHGLYGDERRATALTTEGLLPGHTLTRLRFPTWGSGEVQIGHYVVVRVTKTRLVVRQENAPAVKEREVRLIVRDGEVQTWVEGTDRYTSDSWNLATPDDSKVAYAHQQNVQAMLERHVRKAAENLINARGSVNRENVQAMVTAAQAWLTANPAE